MSCGIPPRQKAGEPPAPFVGAALVVALVGVLIDAGIQKVDAWADKKAKEFRDEYSGRINVGSFALPVDKTRPASRCILLQREVDLNKTDDKTKKDIKTALTLVLQLKPLGDQAYILKPIHLELAYAGARTSQDGNAINLDFTVGIAVVRPGKTAAVRDLVTIQSYSLKNLKIGDGADYEGKFQEGTVIPAFDGATAATISVAVTETGDGADDYASFRKDVDSYGKVLKDFGIDQLKGGLGVK